MKSDNQHLDFLISQYVDGCLEGPSKKSVEQKLLTDPSARELYTEHREVQDLLDDWGNRIPMIDWDGFDEKLATRLEREHVGVRDMPAWRRWMKPVAAAAALFIAATIGYSWHAWSNQQVGVGSVSEGRADAAPHANVTIDGFETSNQPSLQKLSVAEGTAPAGQSADVIIGAPSDTLAFDSLKEALPQGFVGRPDPSKISLPSAVGVNMPAPRRNDKEPEIIY